MLRGVGVPAAERLIGFVILPCEADDRAEQAAGGNQRAEQSKAVTPEPVAHEQHRQADRNPSDRAEAPQPLRSRSHGAAPWFLDASHAALHGIRGVSSGRQIVSPLWCRR
jgi:hypothetical protein